MSQSTEIPLVDLRAQYASIQGEIDSAIQAVIDQAAFIGGPFLEDFEKNFATYCGVQFAVGTSSGTSALQLALLAAGIGPGDEVITVSNTFVATAGAISAVGARPVFVDVEEHYCTLDPKRLADAITPKTQAVIPVHPYGQPSAMEPIMAIAKDFSLTVIEDAAQAHGADSGGRMVGNLAHAACFSFFPGKNLGAYGDAGMVVTNNSEIAQHVKLVRDHGRKGKHECIVVGGNFRLDGLQAAILDVKLKHMPRWTERRRALAARYTKALAGLEELDLPKEREGDTHVYHLYVIRTPQRDALLQHLKSRGIAAAVHYPIPLHLQPAFAFLEHGEGTFPVSERMAREVLSLPIYPELTEAQQDHIVGALWKALA